MTKMKKEQINIINNSLIYKILILTKRIKNSKNTLTLYKKYQCFALKIL